LRHGDIEQRQAVADAPFGIEDAIQEVVILPASRKGVAIVMKPLDAKEHGVQHANASLRILRALRKHPDLIGQLVNLCRVRRDIEAGIDLLGEGQGGDADVDFLFGQCQHAIDIAGTGKRARHQPQHQGDP
jgi:hypothetical protein